MPITPLDLQTLFMQMNQVSRDKIVATQANVLQEAARVEALKKKAEEKANSIQEVEEAEKDSESAKVSEKEKESPSDLGKESQKRKKKVLSDEEKEEEKEEIITDPNLGTKIDIIG